MNNRTRSYLDIPKTPLQEALKAIGACPTARLWVWDKTLEQAWNELDGVLIDHIGWMRWFLEALSSTQRAFKLRATTAECDLIDKIDHWWQRLDEDVLPRWMRNSSPTIMDEVRKDIPVDFIRKLLSLKEETAEADADRFIKMAGEISGITNPDEALRAACWFLACRQAENILSDFRTKDLARMIVDGDQLGPIQTKEHVSSCIETDWLDPDSLHGEPEILWTLIETSMKEFWGKS